MPVIPPQLALRALLSFAPGPEPEPEPEPEDAEVGEVRQIRVPSAADTATARVIDAADLSVTPRRSAADSLRLVPGLVLVQHGSEGKGHQFFVRGFDAVHGSDIEVRVGGVPINEASNVHGHGYVDLGFVIPETIRAVEATKGAYTLGQGNFATAASVDLDLGVAGPERGWRTIYEIGSTNRHRGVVLYAPRGRPEAEFAALEAKTDRGYGSNRESWRLSAMGQAVLWQGAHGGDLRLLLSGYASEFGLPGALRQSDIDSSYVDFFDAYSLDTEGGSSRALTRLALAVPIGRLNLQHETWVMGRRLDLDENFTGYLIDPEHGDRRWQQHESAQGGTRLRLERPLHGRVALLGDLGWRAEWFRQRELSLLEDGSPWGLDRALRGLQQTGHLGVGVRWSPVEPWRIDAGVRGDLFHYDVVDPPNGEQRSTGVRAVASPRLTTSLALGPAWRLFAAYGRGFRSPEARAITRPSTPPENTDLSEFSGGQASVTVADDTEVGARWSSSLFDVGLAAFGTFIARESIYDHVSGFNVELDGTRRLGLDGDVHVHAAPWLRLGLDVTATLARFRESGNPVPLAPPLVTRFTTTLLHPLGIRGGVRALVLGPRPLPYGGSSGVYGVVDLTVGYRRRWWQIDLQVDNLLNTRNREGVYNFASWWDRDTNRSQLPAVHTVAGSPLGARLQVSLFL